MEGRRERGRERAADRERGLEPQRISNKFTEGERGGKKSKREESNENKAGALSRVYCALSVI